MKGDPKKLSYVTSIVLMCAVPMMVLMPIISKAVGMPDAVAGAWLGGTLDTSGSVVAAGALISDLAMKVGGTVKMSQNVLIGVAAFILSVVGTRGKSLPGRGAKKRLCFFKGGVPSTCQTTESVMRPSKTRWLWRSERGSSP